MKHYFKTVFTLVLLVFALSSCSPKMYSLRGKYDNKNTFAETSLSYDDVWNKVIDFFAMNNISVSTIEKESGIIIANGLKFGKTSVTAEDKDGRIKDPNAWFVMPYSKDETPVSVSCSFNVRVKKLDNGNTYVSINIGNISGIVAFSNLFIITSYTSNSFYSTGVFEKKLLDMFM